MRKVSQTVALRVVVSSVFASLLAGCGGGGGGGGVGSQVTGLPAVPASTSRPNPVYHGGALLQHATVATLFWGSDWGQKPLPGYVNGFFQALFADGRYMANLAQYSSGSYQIGNGALVTTATDSVAPPASLSDAQIRAEISAQVAAGQLPKPGPDTLYFVFTPPHVAVEAYGEVSGTGFDGYHSSAVDGHGTGFAYAVIPYADDRSALTTTISHELAEAVTSPQPTEPNTGWYDKSTGEIADIVQGLYYAGQIGKTAYLDALVGADGTQYTVQKVWSVHDGAPIAFAGGG
jgi:hypothetical protein